VNNPSLRMQDCRTQDYGPPADTGPVDYGPLADYSPPSALESEAALLACMVAWPEERERWAQEMVPGDFARPHHAALFSLLAESSSRGPLLDWLVLIEDAETSGRLADCGGRAYVLSVVTFDAAQVMAPEYARRVRAAAERRRMAEGAVSVVEASARGAGVEDLAAMLDALTARAPLPDSPQSRSARDILWELTEKIERRAEDPRAMLGLTTGLAAVDRMTNGLQAPNFLVIGARPGVGKSALLTGICAHVARQGVPVLLFSMEMSQEEVMLRVVCSEARLDNHRLRSGRMQPDEYDRYIHTASWLYGIPLEVNDRSGATPAYMRAEARKFARRHGGLGLIGVDYLQLMRADRPTRDRLQELTEVSIEMKGLAREFDVPLIALSQLNRASTLRADKRPDLADIRETGQIEQDADIVAFLYREDVFGDKSAPFETDGFAPLPVPVPAELIFRKHRNGPQGTVRLDFMERFALFLDKP